MLPHFIPMWSWQSALKSISKYILQFSTEEISGHDLKQVCKPSTNKRVSFTWEIESDQSRFESCWALKSSLPSRERISETMLFTMPEGKNMRLAKLHITLLICWSDKSCVPDKKFKVWRFGSLFRVIMRYFKDIINTKAGQHREDVVIKFYHRIFQLLHQFNTAHLRHINSVFKYKWFKNPFTAETARIPQ